MGRTFRFVGWVALTISGCSRVSDEETRWLIEKTRNSLVFVEGGTFTMGDVGLTDEEGNWNSFSGDGDSYPLFEVTLDSYSIQKFEITFAEFDLFSKAHGEDIVREEYRFAKHMQPGYPVWGETWYQAREYCQWLGELTGLSMDLPTEAQWEYAARSRGRAVAYATDNGDLDYGRNYRNPSVVKTEMPPGSWPPNPLGLYDMTGNVGEWTRDWYAPYTQESKVNPTGYPNGNEKVWRGAGIIGGKGLIALYRRGHLPPTNTGGGMGLRCVVNQTTPVK